MYQLTNQLDVKYRLEIAAVSEFGAMKDYVTYDEFKVLSERDDYKLSFGSKYQSGRLSPYKLSRSPFQTWDHGKHVKSLKYGNCANYTVSVGGGGWWFKGTPRCYFSDKQNCLSYVCGYSNLNAKIPFWEFSNNIRNVQMKIRPY